MMKWKHFVVGLVIHHKVYAIDFELVDSTMQLIVVHLTSKSLIKLLVEMIV